MAKRILNLNEFVYIDEISVKITQDVGRAAASNNRWGVAVN
jgi:hypothetical protein